MSCVVWRVCYSSDDPNTHKSVCLRLNWPLAPSAHHPNMCFSFTWCLGLVKHSRKKGRNYVFMAEFYATEHPLHFECVASLCSMWKRCDPSGPPAGGVLDITVFFCLSKQSELSRRGIQANAGMINTAVGCRDACCSQVRAGLQKSRKSRGGGRGRRESGCFEGSKQNIMRKGGREKKRRERRAVCWRGIGVRFFPQKALKKHTHVDSNGTHCRPQLVLIQRRQSKATSCLRCKTIAKVCHGWHDALTARLLASTRDPALLFPLSLKTFFATQRD